MKFAVIFLGFAVSWGLLAHGNASDGYFVGLVVATGLFTYLASTVSPK